MYEVLSFRGIFGSFALISMRASHEEVKTFILYALLKRLYTCSEFISPYDVCHVAVWVYVSPYGKSFFLHRRYEMFLFSLPVWNASLSGLHS